MERENCGGEPDIELEEDEEYFDDGSLDCGCCSCCGCSCDDYLYDEEEAK